MNYTNYLTNAFSLNMLAFQDEFDGVLLDVTRLNSFDDVVEWIEEILYPDPFIPSVGHEDTAHIISQEMVAAYQRWEAKGNTSKIDWRTIFSPQNLYQRSTVTMLPGDVAVVFQYIGSRLPEGARELPPGAKIVPFVVASINHSDIELGKEE